MAISPSGIPIDVPSRFGSLPDGGLQLPFRVYVLLVLESYVNWAAPRIPPRDIAALDVIRNWIEQPTESRRLAVRGLGARADSMVAALSVVTAGGVEQRGLLVTYHDALVAIMRQRTPDMTTDRDNFCSRVVWQRLNDDYLIAKGPNIAFDPKWAVTDTVALAAAVYSGRDRYMLPILADAIEEVGFSDEKTLERLRAKPVPGDKWLNCEWVVWNLLGFGTAPAPPQ